MKFFEVEENDLNEKFLKVINSGMGYKSVNVHIVLRCGLA